MTLYDLLALSLIMLGLAAIPSSSVALVVARTVTRDTRNGIATALGVVAGDLVLVVLAILGLTALSQTLGALFAVVRYIAAGYLIWFGISLIRSKLRFRPGDPTAANGGIGASFAAGFALTLSDIKAIFFYASLFPAFVEIPALGIGDIAWIIGVTLLTVGGVKVAYVFSATAIMNASKRLACPRPLGITTGGLMIAAGGYLIVKTG